MVARLRLCELKEKNGPMSEKILCNWKKRVRDKLTDKNSKRPDELREFDSNNSGQSLSKKADLRRWEAWVQDGAQIHALE